MYNTFIPDLVCFFDPDIPDRDPVVRFLYPGYGSLGPEADFHILAHPDRSRVHSCRIPGGRKRGKSYSSSYR